MVERLATHIGGFADLHHLTLTAVIVSQATADQIDHTDTSRDPCVLPPVDGQVSRCHLSTLLVLSSEYWIAVQAGSVYGEVSETRFDESHLTEIRWWRHPHATMACPPPPQMGCHDKG